MKLGPLSLGVPLSLTFQSKRLGQATAAVTMHPRSAQFVGVFLATVCLVVPIPGIVGPSLALLALALACIGCSSETIVVAAFLIAPYVFEAFAETIHLPGIGKILAAGIGILLLLNWPLARRRQIFRLSPGAIAWLIVVMFILTTAYFAGLQTPYAAEKLVAFAMGTVAALIAMCVLIRGRKASVFDLSIITGVACVYCICALFYTVPAVRPRNLFTPGSIRLAGNLITHGYEFSGGRRIAQLAGWSLALIVGSSMTLARTRKPGPQACLLVATAAISMVGLNSGGQRAAMAGLLIGTFVLAVSKAGRNRITVALALSAAVLLAGVTVYGIASKNKLFTTVFRHKRSISDSLNRSVNWEAALRRISEQPLLGHGLGGYYIDLYTLPGGVEIPRNPFGPYPHNVFLELLVETGIIGTLIILVPLFVAGIRAKVASWTFQTQTGASVLPFFVYCLIIANVTYDLHGSCVVFGFCAALWPSIRSSPVLRTASRTMPFPHFTGVSEFNHHILR